MRPTLRRGSIGADVRLLQRTLGVPVDGQFGPRTEEAVKSFQQMERLPDDGVVAKLTWAALERVYKFPEPPKRMLILHGMQSRYGKKSVKEIENEMRAYAEARGFEPVVIEVSGDQRHKQEQLAREAIKKGGIKAVYGFSAGGYTARRIQGNPVRGSGKLEYIALGATSNGHDSHYPGVRHMDLPAAAAKRAQIGEAATKKA